MAQKKSKSSKPKVEAAPKAPVVKKITSDQEAIALVKDRFPQSPSNVSYIVLENCNIFYGHSKATALKYAKTFGLKHFDIKT
jgi:hypothetical protein